MAVIYYFRWLYTTYSGYILLLTAIYYFQQLYITFDSYLLSLVLPDCDFVSIQDFHAIFHICRLKTWLELNINLLAFIQFCFFSSSMVSSINFNIPF